jgi:hypothetical protein
LPCVSGCSVMSGEGGGGRLFRGEAALAGGHALCGEEYGGCAGWGADRSGAGGLVSAEFEELSIDLMRCQLEFLERIEARLVETIAAFKAVRVAAVDAAEALSKIPSEGWAEVGDPER